MMLLSLIVAVILVVICAYLCHTMIRGRLSAKDNEIADLKNALMPSIDDDIVHFRKRIKTLIEYAAKLAEYDESILKKYSLRYSPGAKTIAVWHQRDYHVLNEITGSNMASFEILLLVANMFKNGLLDKISTDRDAVKKELTESLADLPDPPMSEATQLPKKPNELLIPMNARPIPVAKEQVLEQR